jgi:hypothetical protein
MACISPVCTEQVSWEGTQLEVACGKKFCKAVCRIKNADPFTKESARAGNGRIGDFCKHGTLEQWQSSDRRTMGAALSMESPRLIKVMVQMNDALTKRAPSSNLFWQLCLFASLVLSLIGGAAVAQMRISTPEVQQAWDALARGDCESAWNTLWPLAKNGNQEARYFLYSSIAGRMIPPGVTKDHTTWYRHVLVLAAYAAITPQDQIPSIAGAGNRFARIDVPASITALKLGPNGERVAQCYANGPSFKTCLDLALSLGVIPRFEEYASKTELAERETGIAAHCLPRH